MSDFVTFGRAEGFAVQVCWAKDAERHDRRPAGFGWSMGNLVISVSGRNITASQRGTSAEQRRTGWYLLPLFNWLADNWSSLFHEEDYAWPEKSSAPAVVSCQRALVQWAGDDDEVGARRYRDARRWYQRHALRAAARGGLFPDLFVRRFQDDVELSWSAVPPAFAPEGFTFVAEPGSARLPVTDVAGPLWELLNWAVVSAVNVADADQGEIEKLAAKVHAIRETPRSRFAAQYVEPRLLEKVEARLRLRQHPELIAANDNEVVPIIEHLPLAVAMFGGLSPDLGQTDVATLVDLLVDSLGSGDGSRLAAVVEERRNVELLVPHTQGYAFAEELLDDLAVTGDPAVDVRAMVDHLGITVQDVALETDGIRGVALAGEGLVPTILINASSTFNGSENGKRFTIAHELCHILFDRTRARRVSQASGPWAPPGIEKRANAFAAYLLAPRSVLLKELGWESVTLKKLQSVAVRLHVSSALLLEHLYNLDFINEIDREKLRSQLTH